MKFPNIFIIFVLSEIGVQKAVWRHKFTHKVHHCHCCDNAFNTFLTNMR